MPDKIPGLQFVTVVMGVYAIVWISLEGRLWQVMVMGVGITAVSLLHLLQKWLSGRSLSIWQWVGLTAVFGLLFGLGSGPLTLVFMAVKTGLHAHGPEFTISQIQWVIRQIPLWAIVGLFLGTSLGMLTAKRA